MQVIFVPFLTRQKFADLTGVSLDTVNGWIRRGYIKTETIGKRSMVNLTSFHPKKINGENYESR